MPLFYMGKYIIFREYVLHLVLHLACKIVSELATVLFLRGKEM